MSSIGKAAVEEKFVEATSRPTQAPTSAPTPAPTYRPTRIAAELPAKVFVAGAVTLSPTQAPTAFPTPVPEAGKVYKTTVKKVVRPVVVVPISLPLSTEEAQDPVMQKSLTDGMADSLGVDKNSVKIDTIDGVPVASRRLADDIEITFKVEAKEATDATKLASTIEAAATSGHIVANIQEQAAQNGVLTPAMKDMPRALPPPVTKQETITVEVTVIEVITPAPTTAPTAAPTASPTAPTHATPTLEPSKEISAASHPHTCVVLTVSCLLLVSTFMTS